MPKYKLINNQTGEETLCDKVTIDEFDYYVNDEDLGINKAFWGYCWNWWYKIQFFENGLREDARGRKGIQKIICTNNPNIDIPKVVDKVERLKFIYNEGGNKDVFTTGILTGIEIGYNKSQETHPNSDEDMIEFNEWCETSAEANLFWRRNRIDPKMDGSHNKIRKQKMKELLQIWKSQHPKKVYYE